MKEFLKICLDETCMRQGESYNLSKSFYQLVKDFQKMLFIFFQKSR